jgi:hypothetical protein
MRCFKIGEQSFLGYYAIALNYQPHEALPLEAAHEQVPFPLGEEVARIEEHAGGRDIGHPEIDRLFNALH